MTTPPERSRRADRPRPASTATTEAFDDELVVYCERTQRMHCLDRQASVVWALCDGDHTTDEIVDETAKLCGVEAGTARADVEATVAKFRGLGLLR